MRCGVLLPRGRAPLACPRYALASTPIVQYQSQQPPPAQRCHARFLPMYTDSAFSHVLSRDTCPRSLCGALLIRRAPLVAYPWSSPHSRTYIDRAPRIPHNPNRGLCGPWVPCFVSSAHSPKPHMYHVPTVFQDVCGARVVVVRCALLVLALPGQDDTGEFMLSPLSFPHALTFLSRQTTVRSSDFVPAIPAVLAAAAASHSTALSLLHSRGSTNTTRPAVTPPLPHALVHAHRANPSHNVFQNVVRVVPENALIIISATGSATVQADARWTSSRARDTFQKPHIQSPRTTEPDFQVVKRLDLEGTHGEPQRPLKELDVEDTRTGRRAHGTASVCSAPRRIGGQPAGHDERERDPAHEKDRARSSEFTSVEAAESESQVQGAQTCANYTTPVAAHICTAHYRPSPLSHHAPTLTPRPSYYRLLFAAPPWPPPASSATLPLPCPAVIATNSHRPLALSPISAEGPPNILRSKGDGWRGAHGGPVLRWNGVSGVRVEAYSVQAKSSNATVSATPPPMCGHSPRRHRLEVWKTA
ncbi:hypothetical protein B0H12DRAFT_1228998 [Mycena haematopus]|nr:hypothetical protein B0H12DRAFT_1228998 [Mycena haematopus]